MQNARSRAPVVITGPPGHDAGFGLLPSGLPRGEPRTVPEISLRIVASSWLLGSIRLGC